MNDHQRLTEIWRLELKMRALQGEIKRWEMLLKQRSDTIRDAHLQIQTGEQDHADMGAQLLMWEQEMATLERRIGLVERGIQTGSMQDLEQAQAQIAEFREKVDETEMNYLEGLEFQDQVRFKQAMARDTIQATQRMLTSETEQFERIRSELEPQLESVQDTSERLLNVMNPTVATRYRLMLEKISKPVAGVVNSACGGCYMDLPTELAWTATQRDLIVHCPTCGVFLLPEELEVGT